MSVLSKINGFEFLSGGGGRYEPRNRYINLDGSVYNNSTHWTRHITRYLTTPTLQAGAVVAVFTAAGYALSRPSSARQDAFVGQIVDNIPRIMIANYASKRSFYSRLPISRNAVIDKKGHWTSDPSATIKMARHYKFFGKTIAAGASIFYTVLGLSIFHSPFEVYPLALVAMGGWYYYAGQKLAKGKWTIQTSPPQWESKKATATSGQLNPANVWTRRLVPSRRPITKTDIAARGAAPV